MSGTLDLNGFDETIGFLFGSGTVALGGNTLTVIQSATATFDGVITGTGGLIKAGTEPAHARWHGLEHVHWHDHGDSQANCVSRRPRTHRPSQVRWS